MGKMLVIGGAILMALGLLVMAGVPLFRLPGDFTVRRGPRHVLLSAGDVDSVERPVHAPDDVLPALTAQAADDDELSKSDRWIKQMAREHKMIEPFVDSQVRGSAISYGVSSYGYDIRVADEFKIFTNINNTVIDPKNFDPRSFVDVKTDVCIVPPNSFALARTIEYFRIPREC